MALKSLRILTMVRVTVQPEVNYPHRRGHNESKNNGPVLPSPSLAEAIAQTQLDVVYVHSSKNCMDFMQIRKRNTIGRGSVHVYPLGLIIMRYFLNV